MIFAKFRGPFYGDVCSMVQYHAILVSPDSLGIQSQICLTLESKLFSLRSVGNVMVIRTVLTDLMKLTVI